MRELFLRANASYTLSLPGTFVSRLSFYLKEAGRLSVAGFGSYLLSPGWQDIPINASPTELQITAPQDISLGGFRVLGRQTVLSAPSSFGGLFSAVYPTAQSLYSAYIAFPPTEPVSEILLPGVEKCRVRAMYNSSGAVHRRGKPGMQYQSLENFPLPSGDPASCVFTYSGSNVSLNGVLLPPATALAPAAYSYPENTVKIGSEEVAVDVGWSDGVTVQAQGASAEVEKFQLVLQGGEAPYIEYDPSLGMWLAGYSPEDFSDLAFLPLSPWQDCYGVVPLPSAFFGGVFRLDFTDLPAGVTAGQEELAFEMYEAKAAAINPAPTSALAPAPSKPAPVGSPSPRILPASILEKPESRFDSPKIATPFFSTGGAGAVFANGNSFTGSSLSSLAMSFATLSSDCSGLSGLTSAYQGFTGSVDLSRMGYSVAISGVEGAKQSGGGASVYIDPFLLNGKTVSFPYPFKCVRLSGVSGLPPTGWMSSYPLLLDKTLQPQNPYAETSELDAFWSDPSVSWSSSSASWGMLNPNLSFSGTPDLLQPYWTISSKIRQSASLGSHGFQGRLCGFRLSYLLSPGSQASLLFSSSLAPYPLTADGVLHTLLIPPYRLDPTQPAAAILDILGEIRLYKAEFLEGGWSIGVTLDNGWRECLDPIFKGDGAYLNLSYWTKALTFDLLLFDSSTPPSPFTLQACLRPDITASEEEAFEPYYAVFFQIPNEIAGFFQVQALGMTDLGSLAPIPPQCLSFAITEDPEGAFSYFGDGWFYCSKQGARAKVEAEYGGQSYTVSL